MYIIGFSCSFIFFFFNDTATTEIYTLSLHDALPILVFPGTILPLTVGRAASIKLLDETLPQTKVIGLLTQDRKSTRLNSSHSQISYAVFCLKKKKKNKR